MPLVSTSLAIPSQPKTIIAATVGIKSHLEDGQVEAQGDDVQHHTTAGNNT
jgi:hypothetical protein